MLEKKPKINDTILEITALRGKNRFTSEENSLHQKPYILIDVRSFITIIFIGPFVYL